MMRESPGMMNHHEDHPENRHDGPQDNKMDGNHRPCDKKPSVDGMMPPKDSLRGEGGFGMPADVEVPRESDPYTPQGQPDIFIGNVDIYNVVDATESSPDILRYFHDNSLPE